MFKMYIVNALTYFSEEDKTYITEGHEISQLGDSEDREESKSDLIKALSQVIVLGQNDPTIKVISPETASARCRQGIRKAMTSNQKPKIRKVERLNLEVHFYDEQLN